MTKNNEVAKLEEVLMTGNLSTLSHAQRLDYYGRLCETLKLNPLTKPFDYITLNGKLVLYANKGCADQLRKINGISIYKLDARTENDVHIVTAYARDHTGREDVSTGAVNIGGLRGEALANAFLKCETKSKRRVTLSIGGLGMLDETEIDSIRTANPAALKEVSEPECKLVGENDLREMIIAKISGIKSDTDLAHYHGWKVANHAALNSHIITNPTYASEYKTMLQEQLAAFADETKPVLNGKPTTPDQALSSDGLTFN